MKRKALIRHLERHGCEFFREGKKHAVYVNRAAQTSSTVPRHNKVKDVLREKSVVILRCLNRRQHNKSLDATFDSFFLN